MSAARDLDTLLRAAEAKFTAAHALVAASLARIERFDENREYTPKEREPYDALTSRFIRAVETAIKCFRSLERRDFAESSDTLRDLLNRMEKTGLITASDLWLDMREVRNRIVHDYLPEDLKKIFDAIMDAYAPELARLTGKIGRVP